MQKSYAAEEGKMPSLDELINQRIGALRPRLLDTTRRNPLINNQQSGRSSSYISIVDEKPQNIIKMLESGVDMGITPLPPFDDDFLPDENTEEFLRALQNIQQFDEEYESELAKINFNDDATALEKQEKLDRGLKDKVRELLELPPRPKGTQSRDILNHAKIHGINPSLALPVADYISGDGRYDDHDLQTLLLPASLQAQLRKIFDRQRTYEEERGLHVTYIALGYLKWSMPDGLADNDLFRSPLILIPVNLDRERSKEGERYFVKQIKEISFNPVLKHKLQVEAGLEFGELSNYFEENEVDAEYVFDLVQSSKPKRIKKWEVLREATLGIFPFQGLELYHDLRTEDIDFSKFSILRDLMLGREAPSNDVHNWELDDVESAEAENVIPHLVLDADSTQFLALLKIACGESIALEGPPGSGKSQTIVNSIACELSRGRKVLFVAQKMTALEVVYARLQSLGLEKFVLPLVGSKEDQQKFYDALSERISFSQDVAPKQLRALHRQLFAQRNTLQSYIELITANVDPTSITVHQFIGLSLKHHVAIDSLPPSIKKISIPLTKYSANFDLKDFESAVNDIVDWSGQMLLTRIPSGSPWSNSDLNKIDYAAIKEVISSVNSECRGLTDLLQNLSERGLEKVESVLGSHTFEEIQEAIELGKYWASSNDNNWRQIVQEPDRNKLLIDQALELYDAREKLSKSKRQSFDHLAQYHLRSADLKVLFEYMSINKIDDFLSFSFEGIIKKNVEALASYQQLKLQLNNLENLGISLSPSKLGKALSALSGIRSRKGLQELIVRSSLNGLLDELNAAKKSIKNIYQIIDVKQTFVVKDARKVKSIISSTGFFGRFGSEYKNSVKLAKVWLGHEESVNVSRHVLAGQLGEVVDLVKELVPISFYDSIERLSYKTIDNLHSIQRALSETITKGRDAGIDVQTLERLLKVQATEQIDNLVSANFAETDSWEIVDERIRQITLCINFENEHRNTLIDAMKLCNESGIHNLKSIESAIVSGIEFQSIRTKIENTANELKLPSDKITRSQIQEYESLLSKVLNFSPDLISVFLKEYDNFSGEELDLLHSIIAGLQSLYVNLNEAKGSRVHDKSILAVKLELEDHINDKTGFNNLYARRNILQSAERVGLSKSLTLLEKEGLLGQADSFGPAILVNHLKNLVESSYGTELLGFSGMTLETARRKLQELDRELIDAGPLHIAEGIVKYSNPPAGVAVGKKSDYSEMALIHHELGKQRRISPRKLLKRAGSALSELFPCWMMVPSSVAQHLPREEIFDLVIIDEASQMTPETSISALMRASQAFISGDTNQLPPSNFFKGLSSENEDEEDVATEEQSILELANTQFHPKHRLRWHYRSKHEELIAFSNHYIYNDDLVIFPSPSTSRGSMGVSLVQVNGTFHRGINPAEAQVVVDHAVKFMKSTPDRSLGIVVMNQSQKEQIDAMMIREAEIDSMVASYVDYWASKDEGLQRFFVKNLENVQGDERDVIFIGTVYGCESTGKFYQRFGPIDGKSGKKRLNVLFTRAKEQIVTFTSIPLDKFQPSDSNEGARLLKLWLQFSVNKKLGEKLKQPQAGGVPDSPFEEHVIAVVESLGFIPVPQVGVSNYYIDIGVKHQDYPYGYICGIECDGATYHSSKSARDRDRLRQEVLERLGWDLYRIWSTDWFRDSYLGTERLKERLNKLLHQKISDIPNRLDSAFEAAEFSSIREPVTAYEHPKQETENTDAAIVPGANSPNQIEYLSELASVKNGLEIPTVLVGSKVEIRYLDGPRAGVTGRFWITNAIEPDSSRMPGYTSLKVESPLGQALLDATVGDIVTYAVQSTDIRVEILDHEI